MMPHTRPLDHVAHPVPAVELTTLGICCELIAAEHTRGQAHCASASCIGHAMLHEAMAGSPHAALGQHGMAAATTQHAAADQKQKASCPKVAEPRGRCGMLLGAFLVPKAAAQLAAHEQHCITTATAHNVAANPTESKWSQNFELRAVAQRMLASVWCKCCSTACCSFTAAECDSQHAAHHTCYACTRLT
jgi:hypothetical protein